MSKKRTSDSSQVRASEAVRAITQKRLMISEWVLKEHEVKAREAAKAAVKKAVKKYQK